jgi:predicted phosphohydrolase
MVKIQYISDTHSKYLDIIPICDYIALLGDIGDPFEKGYTNFISDLSSKFKKVFVISGNHEYYFSVIDDMNNHIQKICDKFNNVFFLNNSSVEVDGFLIVGSTLWSDINHYSCNRLNDLRYIRTSQKEFLNINTYKKLHYSAANYIINEVKKGNPTIIMTHHAPLNEMNGKYAGSKLCSAFSTDLKCIYNNDNVLCWLSGHTQQCITIKKNNTLFSSNCMGYKKQGSEHFEINKYIEIN